MKISFGEAARVVAGRIVRGDGGVITGACIHSKKLKPGDLFFALVGSSFDGHDFVKDAVFRGAAGAVVAREVEDAGPQILVSDPASALVDLAAWVRDTLDPVVVGITGSTGKTTVKDFLASIASHRMPTVASQESFNNDLGVPLTLCRCRRETEVAICEMGTRGPGQIARLCEYARPHVGVVTNVGLTHYEMFGSAEGIALAKKELIDSLPEAGAAVLNADDPVVSAMAEDCLAEVVSFGLRPEAAVRGFILSADGLGRHTFRMEKGKESVLVALPASGAHQVSNALAASAAALCLGLSLEDCRKGLEAATVSRWRMEVKVHGGVVFVNDAYNANPTSVASALETCSAMAAGGRFIAVLGCMAELGEVGDREHRRVGALAAALASRLVVVGDEAAPIAEGAKAAGMQQVQFASSGPEAVSALGALQPGDVVLIKGSRVAGLEHIAELAMRQVES